MLLPDVLDANLSSQLLVLTPNVNYLNPGEGRERGTGNRFEENYGIVRV